MNWPVAIAGSAYLWAAYNSYTHGNPALAAMFLFYCLANVCLMLSEKW